MLAASRPTAVNLAWALERMKKKLESVQSLVDPRARADSLLEEAHAITREDVHLNREMGRSAPRYCATARVSSRIATQARSPRPVTARRSG